MEVVYKRTAAGKKNAQRNAGSQRSEKRRLIQLVVSLTLFVLVFVGRGISPIQAEEWNELLRTDVDFSAAFQQFGEDIADGEPLMDVLSRLAAASFGQEIPEPLPSEPAQTESAEKPEITLLGETGLHGLSYLREHGFAVYSDRQSIESQIPEPEVSQEPVVVTAVAQAYNAAGEKLPSNVSYEYYELGLERTVVPVMGVVTSGFEYRTSPLSGKREFHLALDIAAAEGTEIGAFSDGVVRYIGESNDFGLYLMIDHANGVSSFYAHCSKLLVRKGDTVSCGQTVALVGHTGNATGSHLHFTIEKDNIRLDPAHYVNPQ